MTITPEFIAEVRNLRKDHRIHGRVTSALVAAVARMFPDWTCISEINQTPGGRNDAVLFELSGESICFELFATKSQVDRDLLLLRDSPAKQKIAILIDREIDPAIATAYYRKRPYAPYPAIWLSEVLLPDHAVTLNVKLAQYVLGSRLGDVIQISQQLLRTAHNRIFAGWTQRGIDIYTGNEAQSPTFIGVMSLLVVNRLRKLGMSSASCEDAARAVNDDFNFILQQILFGVPMLLIWDGEMHVILDVSDHEARLKGSILVHKADHVVILLNTVYDQLRALYRGNLPESGNMVTIMQEFYGDASPSKKPNGIRSKTKKRTMHPIRLL